MQIGRAYTKDGAAVAGVAEDLDDVTDDDDDGVG